MRHHARAVGHAGKSFGQSDWSCMLHNKFYNRGTGDVVPRERLKYIFLFYVY